MCTYAFRCLFSSLGAFMHPEALQDVVSVRSYLRVHGFVLLQAHSVAERFAANVARKRPRAAVRPSDVDLQTVRGGKHLINRNENNEDNKED